MSWIGGSASEWKQGLNSVALGKVEVLENLNEKLQRDKQQKLTQLDALQQTLDKQKRKTEEEIKQRQSLERTCEQLRNRINETSDQSISNSSICFGTSAETLHQKKLEDIELENKRLQERINELTSKLQTGAPQSTFQQTAHQDDFWSHFSQSQTTSGLPQRSPFKTAIKKAIETSEENPFKAPLITPVKRGLEVSEENPFKTPRKYASTSTLTSVPTSSDSSSQDGYIRELEKKVEDLSNELKDIRNQPLPSPSRQNSSMENEICSLKIDLEKSNAELSAQEKLFATTNEQLNTYKAKFEEASSLCEKAEQRLKSLQTEVECQRQNNETAKKRLEDRLREKERELNVEASQSQAEISALDQKVKELSARLSQQETLSMNTQNALQASIDKLTLQLSGAEKEKMLTQSRCGQLESSVIKFEKCEEDLKKMTTQLKQEKEMIASQTENLKVKFGESQSKLNLLQSQLAASEQLAMNHKVSLDEAVANHKATIEKEKENFNQSINSLRNEKEKVSKDSANRVSQLEECIRSLEEDKKAALLKLQETEENYSNKLTGVHSLEEKIEQLERQLQQFKDKETKEISEAEKVKVAYELETENLKVKLGESLSKLNLLQSQLAASEQLAMNHKVSLDEAVANHKATIEKEKENFNQSINSLRNEKEKVSKDSANRASQLEDCIRSLEEDKKVALLKLQETEENYSNKLTGVHSLEEKIEQLERQLQQFKDKETKEILEAEKVKAAYELETENLKLKLGESHSKLNLLQSQLAASEQLAMNHKASLDEAVANHKATIEKEKENFNQSINSLRNEKEKVSKDSANRASQLEDCIRSLEEDKKVALLKLQETEENYSNKLTGVHSLEEKIEQLERQLQQFKDKETKEILEAEKVKAAYELETENLKLKLGESHSKLNLLQSQLAASEQLAMNHKASLDEAVANHKATIEKEKENFNQSINSLRNEKEKVSKDCANRVSQLEDCIRSLEEDKKAALLKLQETEENYSNKLTGVHSLEEKIEQLERQLQQFKDKETKEILETEKVKATYELETENLKVKLGESQSKLNLLQSQLAASEQLAMNHKASLDEAVANHKATIEKEKENFNQSINSLRNEKEKTENLKLKLGESHSKLNLLQSQLAASEQLAMNHKASLDEAVANHKATIEKEKENFNQSINSLRNEKEKVSKDSANRVLQLQECIRCLEEDKKVALLKLQETEEIYSNKLTGVHSLEEKIEQLERQLQQFKDKETKEISETEKVKAAYELEIKLLEVQRGDRISSLEKEVSALIRKNLSLEVMNSVNEELLQNMHKLERKIKDKETCISQLETSTKVLEEDKAALQSEKVQISEMLTETINECKIENEWMSSQKEMLEKRLENSGKNLDESNKLVELLQKENVDMLENANFLIKTNDEQTESLQECKEELWKMKDEKEKVSELCSKLQAEIAEMRSENREAELKIRESGLRLSQELVLSQQKSEEAKQRAAEARDLKDKFLQMEASATNVYENLQETEKHNAELLAELNIVRTENDSMKSEMDQLQKSRLPLLDDNKKLEDSVHLKDKQLLEAARATSEIREEFELKIKKLEALCGDLKTELVGCQTCISESDLEKSALADKCKRVEEELRIAQLTARDITIDFECYKEVSQLMEKEMRGEESIASQISSENAVLQDSIAGMKMTISNLGRQILDLQKKNMEMSLKLQKSVVDYKDGVSQTETSVMAAEIKSAETQSDAWQIDEELSNLRIDYNVLRKQADEKEAEVITLGDQIQDLFAEVETLKSANEKLQYQLSVRNEEPASVASFRGEEMDTSVESIMDELNQLKQDLKRTRDEKALNVEIAHEYEEKLDILQKEKDLKIKAENELRQQLRLLKEKVKCLERTPTKDMQSPRLEHAQKQGLDDVRSTSSSSEEVRQANELAELNHELIYVNDQLRTKNEELIKDNDELNSQVKEIRNQVEEVLRENDLHLRRVEEQAARIDSAEEQHEMLLKSYNELRDTNSDVVEQIKKLKMNTTEAIDNNTNKIRIKNEFLQQQISDFESNKIELAATVERLTSELKAENEILKAKIEGLNSKLSLISEYQEHAVTKLEEMVSHHQTEHKNNLLTMESKFSYMESLIDELTGEKDGILERHNEILAENAGLTDRNLDLQLRNHQLTEDINAKEVETEELKSKNESLTKETQHLKSENELLQSENKNIITANEGLNSENLNIKQKNAELKSDYDDIKVYCDQLKAENSTYLADLSSKCSVVSKQQKEISDLSGRLLNKDEENAEIYGKNEALVSCNKNFEGEINHTRNELNSIQTQLKNLDAKLCAAVDENDTLRATIEEKDESLRQSGQQNEHTIVELECLNIRIAELEKTVQNIQAENTELLSQVESSVQQLSQKESENNIYKEDLQLKSKEIGVLEVSGKDLMNSYNEKVKEISDLKAELKVCREHEELLKLNVQSLENKIQTLNANLKDWEQMHDAKCLEVEKSTAQLTLKETEGNKYKEALQNKCEEFDELQVTYKDILNKYNEGEKEITSLKVDLKFIAENEELLKSNIKDLENKLQTMTDTLQNWKQTYEKKCLQLIELEKVIETYREDLAGLKAKFSLNQNNLVKKDKEMEQSHKLNVKLKDSIDKLKTKIKEEKSKSDELNAELSKLKTSFEEKTKELLKAVTDLKEAQATSENLKQKMSRLQVQNKKLQTKISHQSCKESLLNPKKAKYYRVAASSRVSGEQHDNTVEEQNRSDEVIGCSQPDGIHLSVDISPSKVMTTRKSRRSSRGKRRSLNMRGGTSHRESHRNRSEDDAKTMEAFFSELDQQLDKAPSTVPGVITEDVVVPSAPRRVTRSSLSQSPGSSEGGKRQLSCNMEPAKRQKLTNIMMSSLEGLPSKTEKGLNDIPAGLNSSGVIRRSTTPLKKTNPNQMSVRGPLRLLDTNFSMIRPEQQVKTLSCKSPSTSRGGTNEAMEERNNDDQPSTSHTGTKGRKMLLRSTRNQRDREDECKTQ